MNIGLIDVDGHNFPNFALMRLSAWHKAHGDNVEWADAMFGSGYDKVYKSKIFTFSPDDNTPWDCEVVCGGTGYDVKSRLPEEVEQSTLMDYSLYPQYDFSIQFFFSWLHPSLPVLSRSRQRGRHTFRRTRRT